MSHFCAPGFVMMSSVQLRAMCSQFGIAVGFGMQVADNEVVLAFSILRVG